MDDGARQDDRRQRHVRAAVDHHVDILCQEPAVAPEPGAVPHQRGVPLRGRRHVLAPVVNQLHRPAALERQQRGVEGDVRGEFFLAAEATPRGRLDHADQRFLALEGVLQRVDDVIRALHRALHYQHVPLEIRDHPLGFQVGVLLGAGLVRARDHDRSLRERALHIPFYDLQALEHVVAAVLDLCGRGRGAKVESRRLGLDHHFDRAHGAPHRLARWVSEQQHRLVHVAYVAGGEHRLVLLDQGHDVRSGDVPVVHHDELRPVDVLAESDRADAPARCGAPHRHAP